MKCLQSLEYLVALGGAIGRANDKANYVSAVNALCDVDFPLLAQLESQKDASIAEQHMLLIHRSEDQVVIGETSLSFSLDIVHSLGEASTSGVPAVVTATTTLSTTFVEASSVLPIPVSDYEVVDTEAQAETSSSYKIIFEEETLETSPENPAT
ncbi:hypothetical protein Tco_1487582 [Tanacetum coccineum]